MVRFLPDRASPIQATFTKSQPTFQRWTVLVINCQPERTTQVSTFEIDTAGGCLIRGRARVHLIRKSVTIFPIYLPLPKVAQPSRKVNLVLRRFRRDQTLDVSCDYAGWVSGCKMNHFGHICSVPRGHDRQEYVHGEVISPKMVAFGKSCKKWFHQHDLLSRSIFLKAGQVDSAAANTVQVSSQLCLVRIDARFLS